MSAVSVMTSAVPAVTAQDLELEHAELLPARETLLVCKLNTRYGYSASSVNDAACRPSGPGPAWPRAAHP